MGDYFGQPIGEIEMIDHYRDNEIYLREIRFSIPIEKWSEFERSQAFRETAAFVKGLETQYSTYEPPVLRWPQETEACAEEGAAPEAVGSVWDRVRRAFRGR